MKHASNPRRGRGRNNGKRNQHSRSRNYESNSPETKVRGTSQQILDKYLILARDASSAGDRIAAEGYHQYAEHYYRILNPEQETETNQGGNRNERNPQHENKPRPEITEPAEIKITESEAVAETVETVEEKPRRPGRPRKTEAAEPAA